MHTQFDTRVCPDPFAPLPAAADTAAKHPSLERQRSRRAAILAATRRLLAEGGEQFTLQRVSEECEVTVQTIRNCFGRRESASPVP